MNHYRQNRLALAKHLAGQGLIHLEGGKPVPRNFDVDYFFRQNSDFLYLTGVEETGCHLVIETKPYRETLFVPRIDNHHRVWEGHVPSPQEARTLFGVDRVMYSDELGKVTAKKKIVSKSKLRDILDDLRACKSPSELQLMQNANAISARAHREVMARTRPGMREYEVQAIFESECTRSGLRHLAYPSIVATGINSAVLHYRRNTACLNNGDLLLIDAGAEDRGYAADITRTFPVNGRFNRRQRDIYQIVLAAQKESIERARPGIISAELHVHSMSVLATGLKSLGLLLGTIESLVEGGAIRLFYPHGLTHMLGLDVHDTLGGKRRQMPNPTKVPVRFVAKLEPGFVITMEPGIYFIGALLNNPELRQKYKTSVDFSKAEKFLDFGGVRIEDDIVIQEKGPARNLTVVPKEIADIEKACAR